MLADLSVFFVFLFIVVCIPLYLNFNLSLTIYIAFDFAPVSCCVGRSVFVSFRGIRSFGSLLLIETSSFDHRCNSCITLACSGGVVRFFRCKPACFALSQSRLLGELLVATFEKVVFALRPMWASNGENCVTLSMT